MKDLRDAILEVLKAAQPIAGCGCYTVDSEKLFFLQQEFNIHFVEPEDEQIKLIDRN